MPQLEKLERKAYSSSHQHMITNIILLYNHIFIVTHLMARKKKTP